MEKMNINYAAFSEIPETELHGIEGRIVGTVCAVAGTIIAVGTAIYGYGYARGQRDGYRARYGRI